MVMQRSPTHHGIYFGIMSLTLLFLVIACGFLYVQNQSMQRLNRQLIIQNDSVMSVNIELKAQANSLMNKSTRTSAIIKKKKNGDRNLN